MRGCDLSTAYSRLSASSVLPRRSWCLVKQPSSRCPSVLPDSCCLLPPSAMRALQCQQPVSCKFKFTTKLLLVIRSQLMVFVENIGKESKVQTKTSIVPNRVPDASTYLGTLWCPALNIPFRFRAGNWDRSTREQWNGSLGSSTS